MLNLGLGKTILRPGFEKTPAFIFQENRKQNKVEALKMHILRKT